jgi:predicted nucleic acid-binding protein
MKTTHRVDTTSQTSDDPGVDAPSADQLAQMESGEFLFSPAVRAELQRAAQGNAQARAEVIRRLELRLLGLAQPAASDVTEAGTLGHSRT